MVGGDGGCMFPPPEDALTAGQEMRRQHREGMIPTCGVRETGVKIEHHGGRPLIDLTWVVIVA